MTTGEVAPDLILALRPEGVPASWLRPIEGEIDLGEFANGIARLDERSRVNVLRAASAETLAHAHRALVGLIAETELDSVTSLRNQAHHLEHAGMVTEAVERLLAAADFSEASADVAEAMIDLQAAADLDPDPARSTHTRERAAALSVVIGDARAERYWERLITAARTTGEVDHLAKGLFHMWWCGGATARNTDALREAAALAPDASGWSALSCARVSVLDGDFQSAQRTARTALRIARTCADASLECLSLDALALAAGYAGATDDAIQALEQALQLSRSRRAHRWTIMSHQTLIEVLADELHTERALAEAEALCAFVAEHRLTAFGVATSTQLALMLMRAGKLADARAVLDGLPQERDDQDPFDVLRPYVNAQLVVEIGGDTVDALASLDAALAAGTCDGWPALRYVTEAARIRLLLCGDDTTRVVQALEELAEPVESQAPALLAVWVARAAAVRRSDELMEWAGRLAATADRLASRTVALCLDEVAALREPCAARRASELVGVERRWAAAGRPHDAASVAATLVGVLGQLRGRRREAHEAFSRAHRALVTLGAARGLAALRLTGEAQARGVEPDAAVPLFEGLTVAERAEVASRMLVVEAEPGQLVGELVDLETSLLLVIRGSLLLTCELDEDSGYALAVLGVGDCFGAVGGMPGLDVQVRGPATLACVDRAALDTMARGMPALASNLMRLVEERLRLVQRRLAEAASWPVERRLAGLLEELGERYGVEEPNGFLRITESFSHRELGSLVGCTRQRIQQILGALQRDGVIDVQNRRLVVTDAAALSAAYGGPGPDTA